MMTALAEPAQTSPRVLVIVPAYNEAGSIARVVDDLHARAGDCDVIVIDDGSTDGTADCVPAGTKVVRLPINLGIGGMSLRSPVLLDNGSKCIAAILIKDKYSELVIKDVEGVVVRAGEGELAIKFDHRFEWLALFHVYQSKSVAPRKE